MLHSTRFRLLGLLLVCSAFVAAQCALDVDAGEDILVCSDDNTVRLNGSVPDDALSFSWSPADGLSAPNSLIPLVFLDGTPQTFTLTAVGFDPDDNIIANGDFEAGDSDFTTEYTPGTGGSFGLLSDEGQYAISTNTNLTHNNFGNCDDHTGGGQMMVVNGSDVAGQEVWCQFVNVTGGTDYLFNAWAMKVVNDNNDAELQFSINGDLLGSPFPVSGGVCNWLSFNAPYTAAATEAVEICIVNQNTAVGGNDFALDDIYFGEVCTSTDEVNIDVITVEAIAPSPVEIPCDGEVTIDASGSTSGSNIFYNWITTGDGGNIISGNGTPVITVNQPGDYILEVVFDNGTTACTDETTVTVTDDEPTAVAIATDFSANGIDCNDPQIQLSGVGSSEGANWTYSWTTPDGNIVSGENTLTPTINAGGTYEIVVFNTVSGCTAIEVITIDEDLGRPFADVAPSPGIPCGADGVMLDGTLSDAGSDITFEWTTTDGTIVSGGDGLTPFVGSAGTYQLVVGQGSNGCTDTATVVVTQAANNLLVVIADPDSLNCNPAPVMLDGAGSSTGGDVAYEWTTNDGTIDSGGDGLTPLVSATGVYVLTVLDTDSGCFVRDSITVTQDDTPPPFTLAPTDSVTCRRDSAIIAVLAVGDNLTYAWTTLDGVIRAGQGTDSLIVGTSGSYFLTVENTATGCSADTTIRVGETLTDPVADAGEPVSFTCGTDQAMLDGSNSSSGTGFSYAWTTNNGSFVSGAGTQVPVIDAIGVYFLEVTNNSTGCLARDTVTIESNDQAPPVSITFGGNLDCNNEFRDLDGSASASGEGFTFAWSTTGGNFVNGQNTLTPRIDAPGTYVLTVMDTINYCTGERSVVIADATALPAVTGGPDFRLDCNQPTDTLSPVGSSFGAPFEFTWTTTDGSFVGTPNVSNPEVDSAGTYVLSILNMETGCGATDTVVVTESLNAPPANVGTGGEINCQTTALTLGTDANDASLNYSWTTGDGNITGGAMTSQANVDSSGTYVFLVTNPDNGCSATDSVEVSLDTELPVVTIAEPDELNCDVGTFNLDAGGSSFGAPFSLDWQTANGTITGGANTLSPSISAEGDYTLIITNTDNFCVDSLAVNVTGNVAFPTAEAGDNDEVSCRDETTMLNLDGSDEGPGFTFSWSTNNGSFTGDGSGPTPEVDAAGIYYLTIRNEVNNCVSVDSVEITEDFEPPAANAGPNQVITCDLDELSVGVAAVPGYSYFWSSNNGSASGPTNQSLLMVNGPGTYSVLVTNFGNGCRRADNVVITIDTISPLLDVLMPAELNCRNEEVTLSGISDPTFNYAWTTTNGMINGDPAAAETIASEAGVYNLEVTDPDNGCTTSAGIVVTENIAPPVFSLAPAAALNCQETVRELTTDDLGPGFSYTWMTSDGNILNGSTSPTTNVDSAGTYVLTITNETSFCTTTDSLSVTRNADDPELSILSPDELTCLNGQVDITAVTDLDPATAEITWSTTNGTFSGGTETLVPTAMTVGTYQLEILNPDNGCSATSMVAVTENRVLPVIDLAAEVDLGCFEENFTLAASASGQGDLTYAWMTSGGAILNGSTSASPVINGVGTYTVTVTDDRNGCEATAEVVADQNLLEDFAFTERLPGCDRPGGSILFGAVAGGTEPFSYSVDGGSSFGNDPVFQGLNPDNYVLVVRDANGCELEDVSSIVPAPDFQLEVNPNAQIDFGESFQINAQINFPLSEVDTIIWTPARGLDCTDCLDPRATPQETQGYRIRVETLDGCVAEGFLTIIVNEENPVFFPTAFSPNGDGVNDTYVPFASLSQVARITSMSISDRWGENVFLQEDFAPGDLLAGWDGNLNGEPMNPQVLVYSVEVAFVNGDKRVYKGDFTLIR